MVETPVAPITNKQTFLNVIEHQAFTGTDSPGTPVEGKVYPRTLLSNCRSRIGKMACWYTPLSDTYNGAAPSCRTRNHRNHNPGRIPSPKCRRRPPKGFDRRLILDGRL